MSLRLNFPIPRAQTRSLSDAAYERYLEAERRCIAAERAYFACFPQPRTVTVHREELEHERLCRESWEREYRPEGPA